MRENSLYYCIGFGRPADGRAAFADFSGREDCYGAKSDQWQRNEAHPALFASVSSGRLRAAGIPVSYQDIYGSDPNEAAIAELAVAFTSGDEAVTACLQRYGMDLCCAIVSLVNLLDVRAVRLGGFPYLLGEPFAELLRSILAEKFHILTSTGALNLQLFDCKYEDVRKAAVLQTLEAIFSRH